MRYVTFTRNGVRSFGVVHGRAIHDLGARLGAGCQTLLAFIEQGLRPPAALEADVQVAEITLEKPLSRPRVFCVGLNYADHTAEMDRQSGGPPSIFLREPQSLVGPGEALWKPRTSEEFDFEGELACVIGRPGRDVSEVAALGLVFGYACFNDGSVRDFQKASLAAGKNFERSGAFGPWIAPVAGAPAWDAMTVTTRLNGVEVQRGDTRAMIRGVPAIIAYLSRITTLLPGDVIATGTPSGVGAGRQPPLWMKPGDRVEVEIAGVGVLANQVIDQPAAA